MGVVLCWHWTEKLYGHSIGLCLRHGGVAAAGQLVKLSSMSSMLHDRQADLQASSAGRSAV